MVLRERLEERETWRERELKRETWRERDFKIHSNETHISCIHTLLHTWHTPDLQMILHTRNMHTTYLRPSCTCGPGRETHMSWLVLSYVMTRFDTDDETHSALGESITSWHVMWIISSEWVSSYVRMSLETHSLATHIFVMCVSTKICVMCVSTKHTHYIRQKYVSHYTHSIRQTGVMWYIFLLIHTLHTHYIHEETHSLATHIFVVTHITYARLVHDTTHATHTQHIHPLISCMVPK